MKANLISIIFKIAGAVILLGALILKGFGLWVCLPMSEVVVVVMALEALVLPIDISKIKTSK